MRLFTLLPALLVGVAGAQNAPNLIGTKVPAFSMKGVNGKTYSNATLKGKVVLIDLWATWCGPCKAASPDIQKLHNKYAKRGVVVIGANTDAGAPAVKAYMKEHGYTYPFAIGAEKLQEKLQVPGIPYFVVIGKNGKIVGQELGFSAGETPKKLAAAIERGLKTKA